MALLIYTLHTCTFACNTQAKWCNCCEMLVSLRKTWCLRVTVSNTSLLPGRHSGLQNLQHQNGSMWPRETFQHSVLPLRSFERMHPSLCCMHSTHTPQRVRWRCCYPGWAAACAISHTLYFYFRGRVIRCILPLLAPSYFPSSSSPAPPSIALTAGDNDHNPHHHQHQASDHLHHLDCLKDDPCADKRHAKQHKDVWTEDYTPVLPDAAMLEPPAHRTRAERYNTNNVASKEVFVLKCCVANVQCTMTTTSHSYQQQLLNHTAPRWCHQAIRVLSCNL